MDIFLPGYFKRLGASLSEFVDQSRLAELIFQGTEEMIGNLDPTKTLNEVFYNSFLPAIDSDNEDINHLIDHFYNHEFPKLKQLTRPVDNADIVIKKLLMDNNQIVIATNPLFPIKAIEHRIDWAELGVEQSWFSYITNFEELHFTKPHPEFIAETLGKIGWPDEIVVMIGNDYEMDLKPAEILGFPTFLITLDNQQEYLNPDQNPLSTSGTIDDVPGWIKNIEKSGYKLKMIESRRALAALLKAAAANLDSYFRNKNLEKRYIIRPVANEWAPVEIFAHLADVDQFVNIPRMNKIKERENLFIEAISTDQWADEKKYILRDPYSEIDRFIQKRLELLDILMKMSDSIWNSNVQHTIFGPTPVTELIKFITQHDRIHLNQLYRTLPLNTWNGSHKMNLM